MTSTPIDALAATLDRDDPRGSPGDPLPPLWHWLYFLPIHRASELGPDGHVKRGAFLPPVSLPRRMFAGGRFRFDRPLCVGEVVTRRSRITDVRSKEGRTGPLVFVAVRHEISNEGGLALVEEHDIVYRDADRPGAATPASQYAPDAPAWLQELRVDDVMLFRYSALTFNGHRIHYDRRYATEVEGYPGLVVHGPLIATLALELLRRNIPDTTVAEFSFRSVSPLFDVSPFFVCGRPEGDRAVHLWATNAEGTLAMDASATLAR